MDEIFKNYSHAIPWTKAHSVAVYIFLMILKIDLIQINNCRARDGQLKSSVN